MRTHNLFVGHSWNHHGRYDNPAARLREKSCFRFRDRPVPKDDPIHYASSDGVLREAIKARWPLVVLFSSWPGYMPHAASGSVSSLIWRKMDFHAPDPSLRLSPGAAEDHRQWSGMLPVEL